MNEPKTLEEFIGSFPLDRQKVLRQELQKIMQIIIGQPPEYRGDVALIAFMALKRGIEPALEDRPFEPEVVPS